MVTNLSDKIVIVIPARYASSRFPGKPLSKIGTKSMIEYVYQGCKKSLYKPRIVIATDDDRIYDVCSKFVEGADIVVMTPDNVKTGTERVALVAESLDAGYFLNVQGDEPLIDTDTIDALIRLTLECDEKNPVATLVKRRSNREDFFDPNVVKAVITGQGNALYFSRSPLPSNRNTGSIEYFQHIGLYGFKRDFLLRFAQMPKGYLEERETLEQLRVLENGFGIRVAEVDANLIGVDTPEDIGKVENILKEKGNLL